MSDNTYSYEICIEGQLAEGWSDWFAGSIRHDVANGVTVLTGHFVDQAALFGILTKIHYLNLTLLAVKRLSIQQPSHNS
ncbi:MAG: hypothetical protein H6652_21485 [Ardenticatenaceae bacterium]|nr:hypothetical protein [Ardenticatenaceae bacterium]